MSDDLNDKQPGDPTDPTSELAVVATPVERVDRREERILEYVTESLEKNDATQANIGATNGELMLLAYRLHQSILEEFQSGPVRLADLEPVMPVVEVQLKVVKQIERFSKLDLKLNAHKIESLPNMTAHPSVESQ